jgi:hypothetical protein
MNHEFYISRCAFWFVSALFSMRDAKSEFLASFWSLWPLLVLLLAGSVLSFAVLICFGGSNSFKFDLPLIRISTGGSLH